MFISSEQYTLKPRYTATVGSPQFVAKYHGWREIEIMCNKESVFTEFHGC